MKFSDAIDVKDLQHQVVHSRKKAIKLITDIHEAETKAVIKSIKEIESRPINTDISYKPINLDKLRCEMRPPNAKVMV